MVECTSLAKLNGGIWDNKTFCYLYGGKPLTMWRSSSGLDLGEIGVGSGG
jgi:hypothetical protein